MHRVAITGLGPVSSIGVGVSAFAASLQAGQSGISPITGFDTTGFPNVHAGEVQGFDPSTVLTRLDARDWGRSTLFAASAARLALDDAQLDIAPDEADRTGVVVGTTCGESQVIEALTKQVLRSGFASASVDLLRQSPGHRLAYGVSEEIGAAGESVTISTACAASNYAMGYAYDRLSQGDVDIMIAGGADSVCQWVHAGFFRLGTLAKDGCAPFDRHRAGILTAEGGAAVVLETFEHARERGARIYAEVLGYGLNCDADHMVAPNAADIGACMRLAHANARVSAAEVDYICAHGTGTPANDSAELRAIRDVFGDRLPPVSSIKSMLGHTMGAASGFGVIASALAITQGFLPPTINWTIADPDMMDVDVVPSRARQAQVRLVQNDGFAFGGNNAIVMLAACA
jgi:3-oxoacyl-[acyl-carrier-protein] synthase II